jgi:transcriptional regulator with XRE-family HTH domain
MITGAQIRAARALLRWSARDLAERADVGLATVQRLEIEEGVPAGRAHTLVKLQHAMEAAGVEFIGTPDDRPGVRMVHPSRER